MLLLPAQLQTMQLKLAKLPVSAPDIINTLNQC
jgi:hypothetical protein